MEYTKIEDFLKEWSFETKMTQKVFAAIPEDLAYTFQNNNGRTMARIAWHITETIPEMINQTGIEIAEVDKDFLPESMREIERLYEIVSAVLVEKIKDFWTDANLKDINELYGQKWSIGLTLGILLKHEIHHRGQLTLLMRQAGLKVPGVYGPAQEEWVKMGMPPQK